MDRNDVHDVNSWLLDANRDLVATTAADIDVEATLARVRQRATTEAADEIGADLAMAKDRQGAILEPSDLRPARSPSTDTIRVPAGPGDFRWAGAYATEPEGADSPPSSSDNRLTPSAKRTDNEPRLRALDKGIDQLIRELKTLRKGRGLFVRQIGERVGPSLRDVCHVQDTDSPAAIRWSVSNRLESLANHLPEELRIALLAAFALHPDARLPFYQERVRWAAQRLNRDDRAARRRIDEAIGRLAELALRSDEEAEIVEASTTGWHTKELRVRLLLDQPSPEAFEFRRVIADRDRIAELDLAITSTSLPELDQLALVERLEIDVFYGGRLIQKRLETTDRFRFVLELPEPLNRESQHDFAMRHRALRDRMQPHYVCVPKQRCDVFDLHVRFKPDQLPARIWRLADAFARDVDDPTPTGEILIPDPTGEVHTTFCRLTPGLAYGVRWTM